MFYFKKGKHKGEYKWKVLSEWKIQKWHLRSLIYRCEAVKTVNGTSIHLSVTWGLIFIRVPLLFNFSISATSVDPLQKHLTFKALFFNLPTNRMVETIV